MSDWEPFQMGKVSRSGWFKVMFWTSDERRSPSPREVAGLIDQLRLTHSFITDSDHRKMVEGDL